MIKENLTACKTKGCCNPVLNGKYCEQCKMVRKEKRNKIIAGTGTGGTLLLSAYGIAKKTDLLKKVPKMVMNIVGMISKK